MSDIIEKETYNWILIFKEDNTFRGQWSKAPTEPPCGEPELLEWVKWGKELPDDIDSAEYKLIDGELINQ